MKNPIEDKIQKQRDVHTSFEEIYSKVPPLTTKTKAKYRAQYTGRIAGWTSLTILGVFVLVIGGTFLVNAIDVEDSVKPMKKKYDLAEVSEAYETFQALNSVTYPDETLVKLPYGKEYLAGAESFAYSLLESSGLSGNSILSPYGAYQTLDLLSLGASDDVTESLDSLLGTSQYERKSNWDAAFRNNYFQNDKGTTKVHHGVFLSGDYDYSISESLLNELTSRHVEAYTLSYQKEEDVQRMIDWVNAYSGDVNALKKEDLPISTDLLDHTALYLFSVSYFEQQWASLFEKSDTVTKDFYLTPNSTKKVDYMMHGIYTDYYDYGDYVSFYDHYRNGQTIQYIVPKAVEGNLFSLLAERNFLTETGEHVERFVALHVPRFTLETSVDLSSSLKSLGLEKLFDKNEGALPNWINTQRDEKLYVDSVLQKNRLELTEDGTKAHSVTFTPMMMAGAAAPVSIEGNEVWLNQPFAFVIRDQEGLPLYAGQVTNPS